MRRTLLLALFLLVLLIACGRQGFQGAGGGGVPTGTLGPTPDPTPSLSPTPHPTPGTIAASGKVVINSCFPLTAMAQLGSSFTVPATHLGLTFGQALFLHQTQVSIPKDASASIVPPAVVGSNQIGTAGMYATAFVAGTTSSEGITTVTISPPTGIPFASGGGAAAQVCTVPYYSTLTVGTAGNGTIVAPVWNGSAGGIVAVEASNIIFAPNATISADGAGFPGGARGGTNTASIFTALDASVALDAAGKGVGILGDAGTDGGMTFGPGVFLDAGGGGDAACSGGGGGGGFGGGGIAAPAQTVTGSQGMGGPTHGGPSNGAKPGYGGSGIATRNAGRLLFGGGGGGALSGPGGAGGGIIFVVTTTITGVLSGGHQQTDQAGTITAQGITASQSTSALPAISPGAAGGGAGGAIWIQASKCPTVTFQAGGGDGGTVQVPNGATKTTTSVVFGGAGGGGGGGFLHASTCQVGGSGFGFGGGGPVPGGNGGTAGNQFPFGTDFNGNAIGGTNGAAGFAE